MQYRMLFFYIWFNSLKFLNMENSAEIIKIITQMSLDFVYCNNFTISHILSNGWSWCWESDLGPRSRYVSFTDGHRYNFGVVDQQRFSSSCLKLSLPCCHARDGKNMRMNWDQSCFPLQVTDCWSAGPVRLGRVNHRLKLNPVYATITVTISKGEHFLNIRITHLQ